VAATEFSSSSASRGGAERAAALGSKADSQRAGAERSPAAALLAQAARASWDRQRTEELLLAAQALDPSYLSVYRALYKFYAGQRRLPEAERTILGSLRVAAELCGTPEKWESLGASSADWDASGGPARFYLLGMKALAFVWLRQGRVRDAESLLGKLAELDPLDRVGGGVLRSMASAVAEASGESPRRSRTLRIS